MTQRNPQDFTATEQDSLKILKTTTEKKRSFVQHPVQPFFSAYGVRDNALIEAIPVGKHIDTASGLMYGSVVLLFLTLSYLLFFWSRVCIDDWRPTT